MHIGFRTSGGRGEYEIVGSHSGYNAISLEGWTFNMAWPDGQVRETGLGLDPGSSGKPRLRSLLDPPFQIGRAVAAMLLLPDPRRNFAGTQSGEPVARQKGYVLTRIGFGPNSEFTGVADLVKIDPSFVELANSDSSQTIGVTSRWDTIREILNMRDHLPDAVWTELEAHEAYLAGGGVVGPDLVAIGASLRRAIAASYVGFFASEDPVPFLAGRLGVSPTGVTLPPPDEIGEEEQAVKARSAFEYRLAKSRGPSASAFRRDVQSAYAGRCAFCGGKFGGIPDVRSGVDAAHILAWSRYDKDDVDNGLSLCKLHHWAFDAALMVPVYSRGHYEIRFTSLSVGVDEFSRSLLGQDGTQIPDDRLPSDTALRPNPKYLQRLYADLSIELLS